MNKIIAIDYGRKKIGISIGDTETRFAEPHSVIKFKTPKEGLEKVAQIIQVERGGKIVVGVSEGKIGQESKRFGEKLEEKLGIPVAFQDETLTTRRAQELSIKAGVKRGKRKRLEDAYSATLILQEWLDSK